jgi:hypothetical protein
MIPPITHPLGQNWIQPNPSSILLDDTHALISKSDFDLLRNYSHSIPSGVYEGKMWKRQNESGEWFLAWFDKHPDPTRCLIRARHILIA